MAILAIFWDVDMSFKQGGAFQADGLLYDYQTMSSYL